MRTDGYTRMVKLTPRPVQVTTAQPLPGVRVLRFSGKERLSRYVPDRFGTVLHLSGRTEWTQRQTRWSSRPGTIDLKIPGEVHVENARQGHPQFQVVLFDHALVEEARATLGHPFVQPKDNAIDGHDPRVAPIVALHRRLLRDGSATAALEQDVCEAVHAVINLTHVRERGRLTASGNAVARARALLDERLTETVTLDELAAHARLDKFRLCRAFRGEMGLPPHAYVTHRRVSVAQDLLAHGLSQAEVAARVGLYDQSQLHRHFKRIVGVTPGAYARAMR